MLKLCEPLPLHLLIILPYSQYVYLVVLSKAQLNNNHARTINWKRSWKNLNFKFINIREREIVFKYLHQIITTKKRLHQIKRGNSPLCELCNVIEDTKHMFYECVKTSIVLDFFKDTLKNICDIDVIDIKKILHLDIRTGSKQDTNTAVILTTSYISTVWFNRASRSQIQPSVYKACILKHKNMLSMILNRKLTEVFSDKYCNIEDNL